MSKTFITSDTHFGHTNIIKFLRDDGKLLRSFSDIKHHDEYLIHQWNSVVKEGDKVYHLGDVGLTSFSKLKEVMSKLNGTKVLIKGNHDNLKASQYLQVFKDIRSLHILDKMVLSHVPLHPISLGRWRANIHGHLHDQWLPDKKYYNVCVEFCNYTPVDFEEIREYYKEDV